MISTVTGKVLGGLRVVSRPVAEKKEPAKSNEAWKKWSALRAYKVMWQLSLLADTKNRDGSQYTKKDVQFLISDIQLQLNQVEDYLLTTCIKED